MERRKTWQHGDDKMKTKEEMEREYFKTGISNAKLTGKNQRYI
jgi:hypothetical protein